MLSSITAYILNFYVKNAIISKQTTRDDLACLGVVGDVGIGVVWEVGSEVGETCGDLDESTGSGEGRHHGLRQR